MKKLSFVEFYDDFKKEVDFLEEKNNELAESLEDKGLAEVLRDNTKLLKAAVEFLDEIYEEAREKKRARIA